MYKHVSSYFVLLLFSGLWLNACHSVTSEEDREVALERRGRVNTPHERATQHNRAIHKQLKALVLQDQLSWQHTQGQHATAHLPGRAWSARLTEGGKAQVFSADNAWRMNISLAHWGRDQAVFYPKPHQTSVHQTHVVFDHGMGVRQWYQHKQDRLAQGFYFERKPQGQGALTITLDIPDASISAINADTLRVTTSKVSMQYAGLRVWDAQHRVLPARLAVNATGQAQIVVDDDEAVYPVTIDPDWTFDVDLDVDFSADGEVFGDSIAIDGDLAVVGVPMASGVFASQGAAYVYRREAGSAWYMEAKLSAPTPSANATFGRAVDIDGNFIAVSAPNTNSNAGEVHLFERQSAQWVHADSIVGSTTVSGDRFGRSLALDSGRLAVGAQGHDANGQADAGTAYVFEYDGMSNWSEVQQLDDPALNAQANYGWSIDIDGDYIVVGARNENAQRGGVYLFEESNGTWVEVTPSLTPTSLQPGDQFGSSVAVVDQGVGALIAVGAIENSSGGAGSVYTFYESNGSWFDDSILVSPTSVIGEKFGASLHFDDAKLAIGASGSASVQGSVFISERSGPSTWSMFEQIKSANNEFGDRFGDAVALEGSTLLIGAPDRDGEGTDEGRLFVYNDSVGPWAEIQNVQASDVTGEHEYGKSVAVWGDYAVVGAPLHDTFASKAGAVYVFKQDNGFWSLHAKLIATDAQSEDLFGTSVALDNDYLVVGAPGVDEGNEDTGAVYIFRRQANGAWVQESKQTGLDIDKDDALGHSVAIQYPYVFAGAPFHRLNATSGAGAVYLFEDNQGWSQANKLVASNTTLAGEFGSSVAVDGDFLIVGAPAADEGRVYLFEFDGFSWSPFTSFTGDFAGDAFGASVSIRGDVFAVGAPFQDGAFSDSGAVYTYYYNGTSWGSPEKVFDSNAKQDDHFGSSVATDGFRLVVGIPEKNTDNKGELRVYRRTSTSTWVIRNTYAPMSLGNDDQFGAAVAIDGATLLASAPFMSVNGFSNAGHLYTMTRLNNAPMISNQILNATVGNSLVIDVSATDIDDDYLVYEVTAPPFAGNLTGNGPVYVFDPMMSGVDTMEVSVFDGFSKSTATITININGAPTASDNGYMTDEDVPLAGSLGAFDPDGDPLTYIVTQSPLNGTLTMFDSMSGAFTYTPNPDFSGADQFSFKVNDGTTDSNEAIVDISINAIEDPPIADDLSAMTDENVVLNGVLTGIDPEGKNITFSKLTDPPNGSVMVSSNGNFAYTPNNGFSGSDSFTFRTFDGALFSSPATVNITVNPVNDPPIASVDTFSGQEDMPILDFLFASDPENDALTYSIVAQPTGGVITILDAGTGEFQFIPNANVNGSFTFSFKVNDGTADSNTAICTINVQAVPDAPTAAMLSFNTSEDTPLNETLIGQDVENDPLTFEIIGMPSNGVVTLLDASSGTFRYDPAPDFEGADSFMYFVRDGTGLTSLVETVDIIINAVDDPPTASPLFISTDEDTDVSGAVIAMDVDSAPLTYAVTQQPSMGTLTFFDPNTGMFSFTPNANANGTDTFEYSAAADGKEARALVTISINPIQDLPVAMSANIQTDEDVPITAQAPFTEVDMDPLTYSISMQPSNGNVTINPSTGEYTFTPTANYNGVDSFSISATDNIAGSSDAVVTVTVQSINDEPTVSDQTFGTLENTTLSGVMLPAFDVDMDSLTYAIVDAPQNGAVTIVDMATGGFEYVPNMNFKGTDTFTFEVDDGVLTSAVASITITVTDVNDPPVATDMNLTVDEDNTLMDVFDAIDPDMSTLTFSVKAAPSNGSLLLTDLNTGAFTYTPNANFNGMDSFEFEVTDGNFTDSATVNITVSSVNDIPTIMDESVTTRENRPVDVAFRVMDVDVADTLKVRVTQAPANGVIAVVNDTTLTYTPGDGFDGQDSFEVVVNDGLVDSDPAQVTVTVAPNTPPIFVQPDATTVSLTAVAGVVGSLAIEAEDADGDALTFDAQLPLMFTADDDEPNSGALTWVFDQTGMVTRTLTISDGVDTTTLTINLDVVSLGIITPQDMSVLDESPTVIAGQGGVPGETLRVVLRDKYNDVVFEPEMLQEVTVSSDGSFSYMVDGPLFNGRYDVEVLRDGKVEASSSFTLEVLGIKDPKVVPSELGDNGIIILPEGEFVIIEGNAPPGSTVVITDGKGKELGSAVADDGGRWSIKLPAKIGIGDLDLIVEITDPNGKKARLRLKVRAVDWNPNPFDRNGCQSLQTSSPSSMWWLVMCAGMLWLRRRRLLEPSSDL